MTDDGISQTFIDSEGTKLSTAGDANALIQMAQRLFKPLHAKMDMAQSAHDLEFPDIARREGIRIVKPPTGYRAAQDIANALSTNVPDIIVHPKSDTEEAEDNAEQLSRYLSEVLYKYQSHNSTPFLRSLAWHGIVRGPMLIRVNFAPWYMTKPKPPEPPETRLTDELISTLEPDLLLPLAQAEEKYKSEKATYDEKLKKFNQKNGNKFPITADVRDPIFCAWDMAEDPEWVVEIFKRPWYDIRRKWGKKLMDKGFLGPSASGNPLAQQSTAEQYVYWAEIWTPTHYWYGVSTGESTTYTEVQSWKKHDYGFLPYAIDGAYTIPLPEPEKRYTNLYSNWEDMLYAEYELYNQAREYARKTTMANLVAKMADPTRIKSSIDNGTIIELNEDEDVHYLEPTGSGLQIIQQLKDWTNEYISTKFLMPDVLMGRSRMRSGYGTQVQAQLAAQTLLPLTAGMSRVLQKTCELILRLTEMIPGRTYVYGKYNEFGSTYATPSMIDGYYHVDVEVEIQLPSERAQIANTEMSLVQAGIQSKITAAKKIGIRNPKQEQRIIMKENLLASPEFQQPMSMWMAARMGAGKFMNEIIPGTPLEGQYRQEAAGGQQQPQQQSQVAGPMGGPPPGSPMYSQAGPGSPEEQMMMQRQATRINPGAPQQNNMRR